MKIDYATATKMLTDFVREDRAEARIWRTRLENLVSSAVLASFGISAFFIGKVSTPLSADQLRWLTLLVDGGLVLITVILFRRIRFDLVELRRAQQYRQTLLNAVEEGQLQNIDLFLDPRKLKPEVDPGIKDKDLDWLGWLSVSVIVVKMIVVVVFAASLCRDTAR